MRQGAGPVTAPLTHTCVDKKLSGKKVTDIRALPGQTCKMGKNEKFTEFS
jgi:hypothetical protein